MTNNIDLFTWSLLHVYILFHRRYFYIKQPLMYINPIYSATDRIHYEIKLIELWPRSYRVRSEKSRDFLPFLQCHSNASVKKWCANDELKIIIGSRIVITPSSTRFKLL